MTIRGFRLLPETTRTSDHVDIPEFTVITADGEVYTLFRIVRITHETTDDLPTWTHIANVARVADDAIGVAHLLVIERVIQDAQVTMSEYQA